MRRHRSILHAKAQTHILNGLPLEQEIPDHVQNEEPDVSGHSECGTPSVPAIEMSAVQSAAFAVPHPACPRR